MNNWHKQLWDALESGAELKIISPREQYQKGKSHAFFLRRQYAIDHGEALRVSTTNGLKCEQFRMPDGKVHAFMSIEES